MAPAFKKEAEFWETIEKILFEDSKEKRELKKRKKKRKKVLNKNIITLNIKFTIKKGYKRVSIKQKIAEDNYALFTF